MFKDYLARSRQSIQFHRNDIIALTIIAIIGIALAEMPHILWFLKTGSPLVLTDKDDLLYLGYATNSYFNHPLYLSDPVLKEGGPTIYPWIQFIPEVILAKLLGIDVGYINIIWRFWAGLSISIAWFALAKLYLKNTWLALATTLILMLDTGTVNGELFYKHFKDIGTVVANKPWNSFPEYPYFPLTQWRIITPGISLSFLLLQIWSLRLALIKPNITRILLAGASYGLLFYVYFYYWTTVTLAILIAMLMDFKNRKIYLEVGLIGLVLGLPSIINNALIKAKTNHDWLPRTDNFLPISHLSELMISKGALLLLFVTFFYVILKRKDLTYLWTLVFSGLLLVNNQIFTGLQIQNFHWKYVYGLILSFLILLILINLLSSLYLSKKIVAFCLIALSSFYFATGFWLLTKASQGSDFVNYNHEYHDYLKQKSNRVSLKPRSVIAGDDKFTNLAIITDNQIPLFGYYINLSPSVDNDEYSQRQALNFYLLGLDSSVFLPAQEQTLRGGWGPWVRNPQIRKERLETLHKYYDDVVANPNKYLAKFQVKYVALPIKDTQPEYLKKGWKLLQKGPSWLIWERFSS